MSNFIDPRQGGKWLAAARSWLQWHTLNGDAVTWGSGQEIRPPMTVRMIEELVASVAEAAIKEYVEKQKKVEPLFPDEWPVG